MTFGFGCLLWHLASITDHANHATLKKGKSLNKIHLRMRACIQSLSSLQSSYGGESWKRCQLQLRRRCRLLAPFKPRNTTSWIRKVNCTRFSVHNTIEKFFCVHLASRGSEYTYLYIDFFSLFQSIVTCIFGININTMD